MLPGVWRLRLPLPWPGVPHCNAWALRAGEGIVLVDTGYADTDGTRQLSYAMAQVGLELSDVSLLVCTHAHSDHYGLAGPIIDEAGCELWMHPAWGHVRGLAEDPDAALERRIEVARQSGVPPAALERYKEARRGQGTGIARTVPPDRDAGPRRRVRDRPRPVAGARDPGPRPLARRPPPARQRPDALGRSSARPGDAVLRPRAHPRPVGEFLASLDRVETLETALCLAGHGRPFRGVPGKVRAFRAEVNEHLERVRGAVTGEPKTAFEVVPDLIGRENLNAATAAWGIQIALAYLDHLTLAGELEELDGSDPRRWQPA